MTEKQRGFAVYAGLFLVSAAVLHLEILQTRIFSIMLWHHATYLVVTFTLLGFAAAGSIAAVIPSLSRGDIARKPAVFALLFGLTTIAAFWVLTRVRPDTVDLLENRFQYFILFLHYLYLLVPYFFGGLVIVFFLTRKSDQVSRVYFVNLAGSGTGCLLFFPALRFCGGAGSILVVAVLILLGAFFFILAGKGRKINLAGILFLIVATLAAIPFADEWIPILPAPSKMMSRFLEEGSELERTVWDPLCRIDVVKTAEEDPQIFFFQDGDASTSLSRCEPGQGPRRYHTPLYELLQKPKVLVIGVGGGKDIAQALEHGASSITGVEVNESIAALMRGPYAGHSGGLYDMSGVNIVVAEGRSFLQRSEEKYDLIQMTGTDTYSALSSGSFILSESYLYTAEAFDQYLDHLTEDGVIALLRFRFFPPRETARLVAIGAEALKRRGIARPSEHILVMTFHRPPLTIHGQSVDLAYAIVLFKMSPFTQREVTVFSDFCKQRPSARYYLSYTASPGGGEETFQRLLSAMDRGEEHRFYGDYPFNITPVTDDRPFFFAFHKWIDLFDQVKSPDYHGMIGADPVGLFILGTVLLETLLLSAALVLLPLFLLRRNELKVRSGGRIAFYFFALGAAYLFIEISAMQKFVLFLGHPTYSLSIVLCSFLFFSGLGSLFSRRFFDDPFKGIGWAVTGIVLLLVLYNLLIPEVFDLCLTWPVGLRKSVTVLLLAPLAFFMGLPFPLGLFILNRRASQVVPWAFGINGAASVIGSVVSIVVAMELGFSWVFAAAGLLYLAGWLVFRKVEIAS
ncbi:MAG: hypothetical protein KJ645_11515 [Planctomycetes bacterium]|nr:hypothetical protein [Planctomycetota bacterium]